MTALVGGLLAALVAAAGCGSPDRETLRRRELQEPRQASLDEVLAAYHRYCDGIDTFTAAGKIELRNTRTGSAARVDFELVANRQALRLALRDGEIVVVGQAGRFVLEGSLDGSTRSGAADEPLPRRADLPLGALRLSDLVSAFVPRPLTAGPDQVLFMEGEQTRFAVTLARRAPQQAVAERQVFLDRATLRPQRMLSFDAGGELRSEVSWRRWRNGSPHQILVTRPVDGTLARLSLDEARLNEPVPPGSFDAVADRQ